MNNHGDQITVVVSALVTSGVLLGLFKLNVWYARFRQDNPVKIDEKEYNTW